MGGLLEKGATHKDLPEPPKFTPTDIQNNMGLLLALAAFSGIASRQPLTASLNAMAGMIKGVQSGDDARFQKSYKEYDAALKPIIEKNRQYEKEFERIVKSKELSMSQQLEQVRLLNLQYDRSVSTIAAEKGDFKNVIDIGFKQRAANEKAEEFRLRLKEMADARRDRAATANQAHLDRIAGQDKPQLIMTAEGLRSVKPSAIPAITSELLKGASKFGAAGGAGGAVGPITAADEAAAATIVITGKAPGGLYAYDKAGRARLQAAYSKFLTDHDISPMEAAMIPQANASLKTALGETQKRDSAVRTTQERLIEHGKVLVKLSEDYGVPHDMVKWNELEQWADRNMNQKDAVAYKAQMTLFANEFARLSSPQSNAMLPEGARDESREILSVGFKTETLDNLIKVIERDASIAQTAFTNERKRLLSEMVSGVHQTSKAAPAPPAGFKPL